jgi:hypothetical protein
VANNDELSLNKLDQVSGGSLGDVSTMQMRLQMYMDRSQKVMSTLSNILKKISDTSIGIVQNLK